MKRETSDLISQNSKAWDCEQLNNIIWIIFVTYSQMVYSTVIGVHVENFVDIDVNSFSLEVQWKIRSSWKSDLKETNVNMKVKNANTPVDQKAFEVHHTATFQQPNVFGSSSFDVIHIWRWEIFRGALWPLRLFRWNSPADSFDLANVRNHLMTVNCTACSVWGFVFVKLWKMQKSILIQIKMIRCPVSL